MDPEPPELQYLEHWDFTQISNIALLIVLLLCSALMSGSEVALFSLTPSDLEENKNKRHAKRLKIVERLLEDPKKLLATIMVANNFINIALILFFASVSDLLFARIQTEFYGVDLYFVLKIIVITFSILVFGEILPRIYANRNNVSFAIFMAYPLSFLNSFLTPISAPMRSATIRLQERYGKQKSSISVDQLSHALELSNSDTTQEEQRILQGIVTFGNTDTKQVMKNRMDIFALSDDQSFKEIIPEIIENGYSRIPVYKENIDHITGILYVKDLVPYIDQEDFNWTELKRDAYFVPENKKLDDLLTEFKEMKMHLAIVVDEYGGTSGLISMEDIIEEIVGEISDEFDDEDMIFSKLDEHTYVFEGKTPLKDFYKAVMPEDPQLFEDAKGEAETLAGFLLEISKGFPKKKEILSFHNYAFTIEAFEGKRIKQIKLTIEK